MVSGTSSRGPVEPTSEEKPMSRRKLAALAAATTATITLMSPSITTAAAPVSSSYQAVPCAQAMHEAVVQDNVAYNARDEEAYIAVIHPDIIFHLAA